MDRDTLPRYVAERMKSGVSKAQLQEELSAVGWSEEEVALAYRSSLIAAGIPVPDRETLSPLPKKSSAVDVVVNMFSFLLLGIIAIALGTLYFQIINFWFPDTLDRTGYGGSGASASAVHYSIAALIIAFPLYVIAIRLWFRKFRESGEYVESKISSWLTYIVLFIASATLVGDLITTLFTFLQGEVSARFSLKAVTIFGIAGIIFGFYFIERKKIQYKRAIPRKVFQRIGIAVASMILIGIVLGFFTAGSPDTARMRAFDAERSSDLSSLSHCIEAYARDLGQLPLSFADLSQSSQYSYCDQFMRDPETDESYTYSVVTPERLQGSARVGEFKLCAVFALASEASYDTDALVRSDGASRLWNDHGAGLSCDTATAQLLMQGGPFPPSGAAPSPLPSDARAFPQSKP